MDMSSVVARDAHAHLAVDPMGICGKSWLVTVGERRPKSSITDGGVMSKSNPAAEKCSRKQGGVWSESD